MVKYNTMNMARCERITQNSLATAATRPKRKEAIVTAPDDEIGWSQIACRFRAAVGSQTRILAQSNPRCTTQSPGCLEALKIASV